MNQPFYSDKKQNKVIFAAFNKGLAFDDFLGAGELSVEGLTSG